jgi:hypothetical protein
MNWRQRIIVDWPNEPQKSFKARQALQQIEDGLATLAGMGHPLHVEEGYTPPPLPEYPKVVFHILQGQRVVNCQADFEELGDDWYPTMEEARHAAGVTKQNQRGGIFARALPSIFRRTPEDETAVDEMTRVANEAHRRFVADTRAANRNKDWQVDVRQEKRNGRAL